MASGEPVHVVSILGTFEEHSCSRIVINERVYLAAIPQWRTNLHKNPIMVRTKYLTCRLTSLRTLRPWPGNVRGQNELVDSPPGSSLRLNSTYSSSRTRGVNATAGVSESSQVVGSKNSQRVHEQPADLHRPPAR